MLAERSRIFARRWERVTATETNFWKRGWAHAYLLKPTTWETVLVFQIAPTVTLFRHYPPENSFSVDCKPLTPAFYTLFLLRRALGLVNILRVLNPLFRNTKRLPFGSLPHATPIPETPEIWCVFLWRHVRLQKHVVGTFGKTLRELLKHCAWTPESALLGLQEKRCEDSSKTPRGLPKHVARTLWNRLWAVIIGTKRKNCENLLEEVKNLYFSNLPGGLCGTPSFTSGGVGVVG